MSKCVGTKKRQIKPLPNQSPHDRMLVCKVGTDLEACEEAQRGDYVIVKLNFDHSELTPGRLIVIQDGENFTALKYDPAEVDCSEVTAVVMRVDRVVWEHGARSEDEILDAGLIG